MQLSIKPYYKNIYPQGGILIKGSLVSAWAAEIYRMGLALPAVEVYPVPYTLANSIWGCLVITGAGITGIDAGKNNYCQVVRNKLFIPQNAVLYPCVSDGEIDALLAGTKYILHPDFGLVALNEPIDWGALLTIPAELPVHVKEPVKGMFIPYDIRSFQIHTLPPENVLENMEETLFPKTKEFEDKPLSMLEKAKLALYKTIFRKQNATSPGSGATEARPFLSRLEKFFAPLFKNADQLLSKMQMSYEELEKRNQKQVDRLLDLFKLDPAEAIMYAIPLDENGSSRGGDKGVFDFSRKWFDSSLNSNYGRGTGQSGIIPNAYMEQLRRQYLEAALQLIKNGDIEKAAFVYMKLLKNHNMAAQTLENGAMYAEAASVYIKYLKNKHKAAECYEKGSMYTSAIEIYQELGNYEKTGDLYMVINQRDKALEYYAKVADACTSNYQYLKAAAIYKNKMDSIGDAQAVLLKGWRNNRDSFNCLNNYFANIQDVKILEREIENIYTTEANEHNRTIFLQVLKYEFEKKPAVAETAKKIAYEIIAEEAMRNPEIVSELKTFNAKDAVILKDIMRYKIDNNNRKKGIGGIMGKLMNKQ